MKTRPSFTIFSLIAFLLIAVVGPVSAQNSQPQNPGAATGSAFTYQGRLVKNGSPFSESCDFTFTLWDAASGGTPLGAEAKPGVSAASGAFTVQLNETGQFGANAFDGSQRWLGISVLCAGDSAGTDLGRMALSATPYASYALKAASADMAANATTAANSDKLDGLHAADIPAHGSILLGAPGDSRLTGYQALGISNVVCNGCDGFTGTWTSNLSNRVSTARSRQSAVWTGSEIIVWGGFGGSNELNDGFRYNPSSDTWIQIAPSPLAIRSAHTAVWTGSEMIVWGGRNGNTYYNDGARYNPATNTWAPMSTASAPLGRAYHSAVWTGKYMVITGGSDGTPTYFNDIYEYNPVTDNWSIHGVYPYAGRELATMVWSGDNVIVFGGHNADGAVGDGFMFNPNTYVYTPLPALLLAQRYNHSAVWTGTDMIVWGGNSGSNDTNNGYLYNEASNKWTALSVSPLAVRSFHAAVWTGSEMIVWGGRNGSTFYNDGARYNPATNTWTKMADGSSLLSGRSLPSMVWTGDKLIVWGGANSSPSPLGDGAIYNLFLGLFRNP